MGWAGLRPIPGLSLTKAFPLCLPAASPAFITRANGQQVIPASKDEEEKSFPGFKEIFTAPKGAVAWQAASFFPSALGGLQ